MSNNKISRKLTGKVVSDKMDKTVVVAVTRKVKDDLIGKIISRTTKYKAHDESNVARMGDLVEIQESRPISRHKSWALVRVLESGYGKRNES